MTTRENLIPDDQPYGERQDLRAAMRTAGQATEIPHLTGPAAAIGEQVGFEALMHPGVSFQGAIE